MPLTGQEFNNKKGSQGGLLIWIWGQIYSLINSTVAAAVAAVDLSQYYTKTETDAAIATAKTAIETLLTNSYYTGAVTDTKISDAIANLVDNAPTALNTLKELADNLAALGANDDTVAAQLASILTSLDGKASQAAVDAITTSLNDVITAVNGKVDQSVYDTAVAGINSAISAIQTTMAGLATQASVDAVVSDVSDLTTAITDLEAAAADKLDKTALTTFANKVADTIEGLYLYIAQNMVAKIISYGKGSNTNLRWELTTGSMKMKDVVSVYNPANGLTLKYAKISTGADSTWAQAAGNVLNPDYTPADTTNLDVIVNFYSGNGNFRVLFNPDIFGAFSEISEVKVVLAVASNNTTDTDNGLFDQYSSNALTATLYNNLAGSPTSFPTSVGIRNYTVA